MVVHAPSRTGPRVHPWTQDEFHQMWDFGWFIDKRVELIDGEIIDMPPPSTEHCIVTDRATEILRAPFGPAFWARMQMPLDLTPRSEPYPDVAVVVGARDTHTSRPKTALLVVEVSDSTLSYDRNAKASLYAASGISDYWIINLVDRQLEVHRNPIPDPTAKHGHSYADLTIRKPGDHVTPLALPQARIPDIMP